MATDWEITRTTGKCFATERTFAEGEAYYAALFETDEGVERRDYAEDAWQGPPEGCFCFWRGRVPVKEKKPATVSVDREMLTQLFCRLEDEDSPAKQQFRFVLALLLMRKRLLKLDGTQIEDGQEYWELRLTSDQSTHRVLNPRLGQPEIDRLSIQLQTILSGEMDAFECLERPVEAETADSDEGDASAEPSDDSEQTAAAQTESEGSVDPA